ADDADAALLAAVNLEAHAVTFGLERPADVSARIGRIDADGSDFQLLGLDREVPVRLRLVGKRAILSALAAASVANARGIETGAIVVGLEAVQSVPGRLERVEAGQTFDVRVDRARTVPELVRAVDALREAGARRVLLVMGAEGHLERPERLSLGRAA